jgi:hypothetical protein
MPKPDIRPTTPEQVIAWLESLESDASTIDLRRSSERVQKFQKAANTDSAELAKKILAAAENDGQARLVASVTYQLVAWSARSDQEGDAKLPISVRGAGNAHGDDFDQPDIGAAFVHMVRANSELTRLLVSSRDTAQEQLLKQIEYMGRRIDADDAKRVDLYRLLEDLSNVKLRREIEMAEAKLGERRQAQVAEWLNEYLPLAFNRFLGGGPGTGKIPLAEQLVQQFMQSMDEEQQEALANGAPFVMNAAQQVLFAELYTSAAKRHAERERRKIAVDAAVIAPAAEKGSAP